jgi:hypothetical protein
MNTNAYAHELVTELHASLTPDDRKLPYALPFCWALVRYELRDATRKRTPAPRIRQMIVRHGLHGAVERCVMSKTSQGFYDCVEAGLIMDTAEAMVMVFRDHFDTATVLTAVHKLSHHII